MVLSCTHPALLGHVFLLNLGMVDFLALCMLFFTQNTCWRVLFNNPCFSKRFILYSSKSLEAIKCTWLCKGYVRFLYIFKHDMKNKREFKNFNFNLFLYVLVLFKHLFTVNVYTPCTVCQQVLDAWQQLYRPPLAPLQQEPSQTKPAPGKPWCCTMLQYTIFTSGVCYNVSHPYVHVTTYLSMFHHVNFTKIL